MKIRVYQPAYNDKLANVMAIVAQGIPGAELVPQDDYAPADIAVVFGGVKDIYAPTHTKREIFNHHSGRSLLMVESAFVKRGEYYQMSWGGFSGDGDHRTSDIKNSDRWERLGIDVKPWQIRGKGAPVVVMGQLPRDVQVQNTDHIGWCKRAVAWYQLRGHAVKFRPHPRVKDPYIYGIPSHYWDIDKLHHTLSTARAVVTYNSNSAIDAVIAGVPAVACENSSMAWSVAAHGFTENFKTPCRKLFFAKLGYSQWSLDEIQRGVAWAHLSR